MLDDSGRFEFTGELLDLVEEVWCGYQEKERPANSPTERLAGLLYVVAALRQDIEAIWSLLATRPELRGINLTGLLQEEMGPISDDTLSRLRAEMARRNWLDEA